MSERVLLGGCGDLGRRVAQRLLARGDQVWALRRQPPVNDTSDIGWIGADLSKPDTLRALPSGITQLVYLPTPDRRDEAAYRSVFIDGLRNLLVALDRDSLKRVLFVSSSAVYGAHAGAWVDEETPPAPPGFNGTVLLEAERLLADEPLTSIVLRLAGLYGPGRSGLLDRLREGMVKVPRETAHWANRIHIDDAAAAVIHLLQLPQPQALYLGVDSTPLPLDVLYGHLCELIGAQSPPSGTPPSGIGSKRLNNARLLASGLTLRWPDSRSGYAALLNR